MAFIILFTLFVFSGTGELCAKEPAAKDKAVKEVSEKEESKKEGKSDKKEKPPELVFKKIAPPKGSSKAVMFDAILDNLVTITTTENLKAIPKHSLPEGTVEKVIKEATEGYEGLIDIPTGVIQSLPEYTMQYLTPAINDCLATSADAYRAYGFDIDVESMPKGKDRLPKVISPQMAPYATEHLSPYLYFLLMPEALPQKYTSKQEEEMHIQKLMSQWSKNLFPVCEVNNQKTFFKKKSRDKIGALLKQLKEEKSKVKKQTKEKYKKPEKDYLLSDSKIKSFIEAMPYVRRFGQRHMINISDMGHLEEDSMFDELSYPCRTMVKRLEFLNAKDKLTTLVNDYGFTADSWAKTCDRVIKASRVSSFNIKKAYALRTWRKDLKELETNEVLSEKIKEKRKAQIESVIEMFTADKKDVEAIAPYLGKIRKEFKRNGGILMGLLIYNIDGSI